MEYRAVKPPGFSKPWRFESCLTYFFPNPSACQTKTTFPVKHTLTITVLLFLLSSCVAPLKYRELEADRDQLERQNRQLTDELASMEAGQRAARENESLLNEATRELNAVTSRMQQLQRDYDLLSRRYDQILNQNQEVLSVSSFEKSTLEAQLAEKERELDRQEQELRGLESSLNSRQNSIQAVQQDLETARRQMDAREDDLRTIRAELQRARSQIQTAEAELAQRSARVNELEQLLQQNQQQMQSLRAQINEAVRGFRAEDLAVTERNGKIYVSLNQNLLFPKGSATLQTEGNRALNQLATVLKNQPNLDILVEGHTDTDGTASRNWTLSAERAVTVTQMLINGGLDPKRVIPAGRAFYQPIAPNDTPANKQRNRRVEIVLSPRLDRLYELTR